MPHRTYFFDHFQSSNKVEREVIAVNVDFRNSNGIQGRNLSIQLLHSGSCIYFWYTTNLSFTHIVNLMYTM